MKKIYYFLIFISFNAKGQTSCQNYNIEAELNKVIDIIVPTVLIEDVKIISSKNLDSLAQIKSLKSNCDSLLSLLINKKKMLNYDTIFNTENLNKSQVKIKFIDDIIKKETNTIYINTIIKYNCIVYFHLITHLQNHYNEFLITRNLLTNEFKIVCESAEMQ
jgi:hypothetical protein